MASEKLTRKEIREPDPFERITRAIWAKLVERQKLVGLALLAVFALFVVAAVAVRMSQAKSKEAGAALARAMELARRPVEGSMEALQDPKAEKFPTFKAKNEAMAKALDEVRAQHPGTEAARTATVFWADAEFQLGKLDEATKGYEEYLAQTRPGDSLRVLADEGLGYSWEAKKDLDKAYQAFDAMNREAAGDPEKARAAYQLARILEEQGKKTEAAQAFQKVKDEYKEAPAARDADERLALLAMQGVAVPEKAKDATKTAAADAAPKKP